MICFIGPPCIGKGYQIDILKKKFIFDVFSFGEYLRSQINLNTDFGKKIKSTIDSGEIIPSNLIFSNMDLEIMQKEKLILDGFPRNIEQVESFIDFCQKQSLTIEHVIELSVNNLNILHERVSNRQSAARTDDILNIFNARIEFYYSERLNLKNIFIKNNIKYSEVDVLQDNHTIYSCLCFLLSNWLIKR